MMSYLKKTTVILLALFFAFATLAPVSAAEVSKLDKQISDTAAYVLRVVDKPVIGNIGGEWAVIGLARSGCAVPDSYYDDYYARAEKYIAENNGVLHDKKLTEYSRVILGITAAGRDASSVAGYDLTKPLEDFEKTVWQGINGPIWALIALDSGDYANDMRRRYIGEILSRQLADGGWALSGETGDPDMTGMALTALAKYRAQPDARRAIDRALGLRFDYATGEGAAQMLVAYATLGEPTDALVDELLRYRNSDGGFNHIIGGGDSGQMATEQALYALAAARRARDGEKTLYDMSDVTKNVSDALASATANHSERPADKGLPGKREDVTAAAVTSPGKTFADISGHANQAAIEALAARGIISGKAENRFAPDATITRAEFASIITSGLGLPERPTPAFDDVPASAWFFPAVGSARYYGIVSGSSPKTFNPNGIVTRQESAVMITKAAKLCGIDADIDEASVRDTLAQFGDYRAAADWAKPSLAFCYVNDIWDDSELDINPSAPIKRCEMAEMLYRLSDAAKLL